MTGLMSNQAEQDRFKDVSDVNDVPVRKMKHVEVKEKELLLANSNGRVYALCDRCSHMNAPLSLGTLNGKIVTCPLHGARFDVTTGKRAGEPMTADTPKLPEPLPENLQMFAHSAEIMSKIKTHDLPTYGTKIEGYRIIVRMGFDASRN
jgi:nitrite reductase/ring-hydroxylating ferredoxin subunit